MSSSFSGRILLAGGNGKVQRILLILITSLLFSVPLWGQDPQATGEEADEPATAEPGELEEDPLADLDEGGYDDQDEDDFVPTEEIPYDQDIPFPTDI